MARELYAWSQVQPEHPNILAVQGDFLDSNEFREAWIITPWQENGDLPTYLLGNKPDQTRRLELVSIGALFPPPYMFMYSLIA